MQTPEAPKPSRWCRVLRSIRAVLRGPGTIDDRRNAAQADAGKYGTYGAGDQRGI